ncbi:MAG: hypothetical protein ACKOK8_11920 [Planctomycetia bacterium]
MTEPHANELPPRRQKPGRPSATRAKTFRMVFINGRQVRVGLEPMIEGMPLDEFIRLSADPVFLHDNELWDLLQTRPKDG